MFKKSDPLIQLKTKIPVWKIKLKMFSTDLVRAPDFQHIGQKF